MPVFIDTLIERLASHARDGTWGYSYRTESGASEATALAALALHAHGAHAEVVTAALDWLAGNQQSDGSVPVTDKVSAPGWTTSHALLAWSRIDGAGRQSECDAAKGFLFGLEGDAVERNELVGHDGTIIGWPGPCPG